MKAYLRCKLWLFLGLLAMCGLTQAVAGEPPVVIGATASLEGRYVEPLAMIQQAYRLWADEVNQRGGLLGRQVKLILYDDKSDRDLTRRLYIKLIKQDMVDLVFSPYSTPLTLAASEVSEANKMLMLAVGAAAETPWRRGYRHLFQLYAPAKREFIGLLDMMARHNLTSLSVLYDETSAFNLDMVAGIKEWAGIYKLDIVSWQGYRDGKKDLPGVLTAVKAAAADGLVLSAYPPDCYELIRLLGAMQYRPKVLAMTIAPVHPDFYKKVGEAANGILAPSQWEPIERIPFPGTQRFIEQFKVFTGHLPSFHAASAYAACQLYEQAVEHAQSLDNEKLRDYIAALNTVTVLGRFKVDPAGVQVGHNSFIIQWQDGKKEIVWPQKMQTADAAF